MGVGVRIGKGGASVAPAAGPQGFLTLRAPRHACTPADLQTSAVLRCPLCTSPLTRHPRVLCRCLATPPYFWPDAASRRGAARTAHLGRGGAAAALPDRRPPPRRRQLVRESAQPDDRPPTTQEPRFPAKDPIVGRGRCYKVVCRSPETWAVLSSIRFITYQLRFIASSARE